jgi:hypothetical protein
MSSKIVNVDQMHNGVLVNFEDGAGSFFDADLLYEQLDKRIKTLRKRIFIALFGPTSARCL